MRATWHFSAATARLESEGAVLLELRRGADGALEAPFEQVLWRLLDLGYWEPCTEVYRNGVLFARLARPIGMARTVLTVLDGDRYHFKIIHGNTPRLSLVNGMGREVMVQRAVDPGLLAADVRIHRERIPRGDLAVLLLLAGHVFHGILRERSGKEPLASAALS